MTTDYTHPEYKRFSPLWCKVRDACAGEDAVKAKGEKYLPSPDEGDVSATEQSRRYSRYLDRAVYFNATGRTLQGLVGIAYSDWPAIKSRYDKLLREDADGSGVGIIGQSQLVLADVLQTGRTGLLADYSRGDGVKRTRTVAEAERQGMRPYINSYPAESILTWEMRGTTLTRVVLKECFAIYENGEARFMPQLRELVLKAEGYTVLIWKQHTDKGQFILDDTIPIGLSYIPFTFVGAVNNDSCPDTPPLLDLANLNLAHYRNSADFEESAFLMGQPMLAIAGVTEEWIEKRGQVCFGSRSSLALPEGGSAQLLQVTANTMAQTAMIDKERMMQLLGARLIGPGEAVKTATQSASDTKASYGPLSLACDNVSEAYTRALQWLETWGTGATSDASFAIDTAFNDLTLDANAIRETVAAWQAGLVPQSDAWRVMRQLGVIDQGKTDVQLQGEIEAAGPPLRLDEAA
jgi:hypothetical protein